MRVLLFLTALGLVSGAEQSPNYASWNTASDAASGGYSPRSPATSGYDGVAPTAGSPTYATARDSRYTRSAGATSGASTTGFNDALDKLVEILNSQLDTARTNLASAEKTYDEDKCRFEKIIKAQAASAVDEKRRYEEAQAEFARWDSASAQAKGEKDAAQVGAENMRAPIAKSCDDWVTHVCADDAGSLRKQLQANVDNAAILYAVLSKLIEARPEFNFGATLGFMQLSNDQISNIEVSEQERQGLTKIPGLTAMVQTQITEKLKGYGGGGAGVVGLIKGVYEATVGRAQDLVEDMNKHGLSGSADALDNLSAAQCKNQGLGGGGSASCPAAADAFEASSWTSFSPVGTDFYSDLLRTQLGQFRTAMRKYKSASTKYNDASSQRALWQTTDSSAKSAFDLASETQANAELDLQQCQANYDTTHGDAQDLIQGLNKALETLTDPAVVGRLSGDAGGTTAPAFIQFQEPPSLLQVSMHTMKVGLMQKTTLAAQGAGFTGVITAIGDMIEALKNRISDETQRKTACVANKASAESTKNDMAADVAQLNANIGAMAADIAVYEADIKSWEDYAADVEKTFNADMHTAQEEAALSQKEKDEAALNERTYQRILGVLSNIALPQTAADEILGTDGVLTLLLAEVQTIQDNESVRLEEITTWANNKRDTYGENIRTAKIKLASANMSLANVRQEHRTTEQELVHASSASNSAETYFNDVAAACDGLTSGVQAKSEEWQKEIDALTQITAMLNTGVEA